MPALTYLSSYEVERFRKVPNDAELDELLQTLRSRTREDWLLEVVTVDELKVPWVPWWPVRKAGQARVFYALYADAHGEWQLINLAMPEGGSVFVGADRSAVVNFMLGYLCGLDHYGEIVARPTSQL